MGNVMSSFRLKPVTLRFEVGNISKIMSPQKPPSFELHSETTTIGELQACIRGNKDYTGYPHIFPHVLIINDNRLLLEEFMQMSPSGNLYSYLTKHGFRPSEDDPNTGGVVFAVCNYKDLYKFQHEGKLNVNILELDRIADRLFNSAEAMAYRGMKMQFSGGGFNPMMGLALGRAMVAAQDGPAYNPEEDSRKAWQYKSR